MTIESVKELILMNKDKVCDFRLNSGRNQVEEFSGKIVSTYKAVFLIEPDNGSALKSFSYSDVLIGNLEIMM